VQQAATTTPLTGLAMKRRGSVAVWLGLPIITLGIYPLVWYFKIHKELKNFDQRLQLSPGGSLCVLLFLGWTCVAPLVSYYNTGKAVAAAQRAAGIPVTCSPAASCWLALVFGLNVWYIQKELNLVVDAYQGTAEGTSVTLAA
jgi:hypothetical protein